MTSGSLGPLPAWLSGRRGSGKLRLAMLLGALLWVLVTHASSWKKSAAVDEVPHLGAGLSILARGDFRMNPEHPPLMKVIGTLPVYLFKRPDMRVVLEGNRIVGPWVDSRQNEYGYYLLFRGGREPLEMLALARVVPVLVAFLGGVFAYLWGRELSGRALGGTLSAFFLLTYPEYAGHGRLLTFDVPTLTACAAVSWFALRWWKRPDGRRAAGLVAAVAIGSQVKLPVTVFSGFVLATLMLLSVCRRGGARGRGPGKVLLLCLILGAAYLGASWAGAAFRFSHHAPGSPPEQRATYLPPNPPTETGLRSRLVQAAWEHRLLPETALATINHVGSFGGRPMFLFGELSRTGWYHYFFVTMAAKTPLPMLAGLLVSGMLALVALPRLRRTARGRWRLEQGILLGLPFALLFALYCWSRPNIGHRQILFVYFPLCVMLGSAAARGLVGKGRAARLAVVGLVAVQLLGFAAAFPHYETYFNELIRTPYKGRHIVMDSNIDWGTDLPLAAETVSRLGYDRVNYAAFGLNKPESYGIRNFRWLLPNYPFARYMPEAQPPDPELPTLMSLHTFSSVRVLYPGMFSREPDLLLNSFVLYLPESNRGTGQ